MTKPTHPSIPPAASAAHTARCPNCGHGFIATKPAEPCPLCHTPSAAAVLRGRKRLLDPRAAHTTDERPAHGEPDPRRSEPQ